MQSVAVFLDIAQIADLRWKNAVCRTEGVGHVIHILFESSLDEV